MDHRTVAENARVRSARHDFDTWVRRNPAAGLAVDALVLGEPTEAQVHALLAIAFEIREVRRLG
jgi:hypothetical protein